MPYLPIESVKVNTPNFELTFTDGIDIIRVVSKTLPETQTWLSVDLKNISEMRNASICFKKMSKSLKARL